MSQKVHCDICDLDILPKSVKRHQRTKSHLLCEEHPKLWASTHTLKRRKLIKRVIQISDLAWGYPIHTSNQESEKECPNIDDTERCTGSSDTVDDR